MASSHQPVDPAVPAAPLLSISVDDLLITALEGISTCEDFNLESFLSDQSQSSEPPVLLEKFTLFPKLAAEIRLKIWTYAYANLKGRKMSIEPPLVKVPSLLQVCYDSRKMGLGIYTRQKHESRDYMPSFVTIIDFEKDTIDLTARGKFINPRPSNSYRDRYLHKTPTLDFAIAWRNNLLMYTIYHFPELCKYVKRLTLRSCYLSWLSKLGLYNVSRETLSVEGFFKMHFPALETVAVLSSGVAETLEDVLGLSALEALERQLRDLTLYRFLRRLGKEGRFKFKNIGPLDH